MKTSRVGFNKTSQIDSHVPYAYEYEAYALLCVQRLHDCMCYKFSIGINYFITGNNAIDD